LCSERFGNVSEVALPPAATTTTVDAARLRLAVMRLSRRLRQRSETGISPSQVSALATLDRSGPLSLGDLAAAEQITPSTLTRIVAALEADGFIARTSDPADRRVARVAVTPAGAALLTAGRARGTGHLAQRLAALDPADVAALSAALPALERLVGDDA
jgi:DNA-binding MarR family transcriptional regulator